MVAADGGNPNKMAVIHPTGLPRANAGGKEEIYPSFAPIVSSTYPSRGGEAAFLPGFAVPVGKGVPTFD